MRWQFFLYFCILVSVKGLYAQNAVSDNRLGGWLFMNVSHNNKNGLYFNQLFEFDNCQFSRFDCIYGRTSVGYKFYPWLKVGVNYVPYYGSYHKWKHFMETDVEGSLKSGNLKVSVRERYRHGLDDATANELRSRLKVAYHIPDSRFGFYLAPEVFTWRGKWLKTRHYVSCMFDLTDKLQIEGYYMYYAFKDKDAMHVIGLGLNIEL